MIEFFLDANLPRSTAPLLRILGHFAVDARDVGLASAPDEQIARYVAENRLVLITRDFDFSDTRKYPPTKYAGIVVLDLRYDAIAAEVNALIRKFTGQSALLEALAGKTAIVGEQEVRFRQ